MHRSVCALGALTCAAFMVAGSSASAQGAKPAEPSTTEKQAAEKIAPAPTPAVTKHRITLAGKAIAYTATAATIDLKNPKDEVIGRMFYVAYTQDDADAAARPLTFVFNGGPGSSTIWLHMGSFGPVRVDAADAQATPPPPYKVAENPDSLLDKTDLVFVDAMGTGFSRILGKGESKDFYGTDQDVDAFAQFIQRYLGAAKRWNSPKFLLGESYGTTRSAALLSAMHGKGVVFNGAVMVSCYLNAWDDFNGPAFSNDLPYELYLPTMAAAAWYHNRLEPKPADLAGLLKDVRRFALGEYAHALAQGSSLEAAERDAVAAKLHQFTAMPLSMILNANLRVSPDRFEKELLRGERRTIGRLDARFKGIDHDAAGESPEFDAADAAFSGAFTASFNNYVRAELKFETDDLYRPTNYPEVGREWDDRHRTAGGRFDMPDVAEDLRDVMSKNPRLKILTANGYFDFATPFFETEYTVSHMGLDDSLAQNISFAYYQSGHMIYLNGDARRQMKSDIARFFDGALTR
jgi:carboxypeptidase C (cathepsin A)